MNPLKRICLIVQSYYLRDPRVRREAEALADAGYEVDVICVREKGRPFKETVNGVNITRIPVARRRATLYRYMLEYTTFFICVSILLILRLFRKRYDVIHVNNMPDFLVFSTLVPKMLGTKVLLDVHDPMAEVFMSKYEIRESSPVVKLLKWQQKISLRYCHQALTVTQVMKELLQRQSGYTPVSVVLNVPDERVFQRPPNDLAVQKSQDQFSLLYTGTISARYGLDIAVEAVAQLRDKIPGLRLRLVGEGDDLPQLREMVDRFGLNDVVRFHPPVPLSEVPALIAQSDLGISPHVGDSFTELYFSTKVAEFVNLGLPTVVTRTQTMERYFDPGIVRYCESGSVESFANAVLELYQNPQLRAQMSENCRKFSEKWRWADEKEKYLGVIRHLVGIKDESAPQPLGRVLILVENLSVPFDRRVWMESLALTEAGYKVAVICPTAPDDLFYEVIDGVSIFRYPGPKDAEGILGYLWEFGYSMFAAFRLARRVHRVHGFDVIQACNPPDTFFVIGWFFKRFHRKKFIFDHHDLSPELYGFRFNKSPQSLVSRILLWLERCTFNTADIVISPNESLKDIAMTRGRKRAGDVFVVRNGPDLNRFKPRPADPALRMGRDHLVCYVGVMAVQDGLEYLLRAVSHVVHDLKRQDTTFVLIGSGDKFPSLQRMAVDLDIRDYVVFTGRLRNDDLLATYLSTADVCVAPDPKNDLNDKCTLIKIPEYMAMGKPVVSFDLRESRLSAGDAALYATPNDTNEFGDRIVELLDQPERRKQMGEYGVQRVRDKLSWAHSTGNLLAAYRAVLGNGSALEDKDEAESDDRVAV